MNHADNAGELPVFPCVSRVMRADVQGDALCSDRTLVNSENGITFYVLSSASETQHSLHYFSVSRPGNRENTKGEGNTGVSSSQTFCKSVV